MSFKTETSRTSLVLVARKGRVPKRRLRHRHSKRLFLLSITHMLRSDHAAAMILTRIVPVTILMTVPEPSAALPPFQIPDSLCLAPGPRKGQRILIRSSLEQLVRERQLSRKIVFEGSVNQDRICTFYEAADVFALASFAEGIPVVFMETVSMEIPCIATCINGIPELIHDGSEGLLVPHSDSSALAAAIARLRDDAALREFLG
jgi:glycosyltransferase involved in cell wall biosynthesis